MYIIFLHHVVAWGSYISPNFHYLHVQEFFSFLYGFSNDIAFLSTRSWMISLNFLHSNVLCPWTLWYSQNPPTILVAFWFIGGSWIKPFCNNNYNNSSWSSMTLVYTWRVLSLVGQCVSFTVTIMATILKVEGFLSSLLNF